MPHQLPTPQHPKPDASDAPTPPQLEAQMRRSQALNARAWQTAHSARQLMTAVRKRKRLGELSPSEPEEHGS